MKFKEMNLPNKLTTIRMICVPIVIILFVLIMLHRYANMPFDLLLFNNSAVSFLSLNQLLIAIIFSFASITDYLDGKIARKNNLISEYGKLMDPLADKLLVNTTLILMLASNMYLIGQESFLAFEILTITLTVITIARDIFVDALRMQALKKGVVVAASIWGKLKTATLMPGILILLLGSVHPIVFAIGLALISIGSIFAIVGGINYFRQMHDFIGE